MKLYHRQAEDRVNILRASRDADNHRGHARRAGDRT